MKAAFTIWKDRIAPVFDVAGQVMLVDTDEILLDRTTVLLPDTSLAAKVQRLQEYGIAVLVCGAMSRAAFDMAQERQIEVHAFVAGPTEQIIEAWQQGQLAHVQFAMPGCRHRRRRRCCKQVSTEFKVPSSKLEE